MVSFLPVCSVRGPTQLEERKNKVTEIVRASQQQQEQEAKEIRPMQIVKRIGRPRRHVRNLRSCPTPGWMPVILFRSKAIAPEGIATVIHEH